MPRLPVTESVTKLMFAEVLAEVTKFFRVVFQAVFKVVPFTKPLMLASRSLRLTAPKEFKVCVAATGLVVMNATGRIWFTR